MPKQKQLPPDVQKHAVAYGRYSYAGQRDVSIEQQLSDIRAYAKREGFTIIHEYADHAKSGYRNSEARHEFNAMLEAAKNGSFGTIIVWKVDRFGRNREESAIFKGRLRQYGVKVIYAMEPIPEGSAGVLLEGMLEATAEWYSRSLSENVGRGMRDNAMKCLYNGNEYNGYVKGTDGRYALDPEQVAVVREMRRLLLEGNNAMQISKLLTEQGIVSGKGIPYSDQVIRRLLRDERYCGVYIWRDIRIEGGMPAIFTREEFDEMQPLLRGGAKRISKNNVNFILTGKVFCGHCGTSMAGDSGKSQAGTVHYYYSCMRRRNHKQCNKRSIRKEVLEKAVVTYLLDVVLTDDNIERMTDLILQEQKESQKQSLAAAMKSELSTVRRKIQNINNAIAEGIFSSSTRDMLLKLEAEAAELEETIAVTEFAESQLLTKDKIVYWMKRFTDGDPADEAFSSRLVNIFLNSVFLYDSDQGPRAKIIVNACNQESTVTLNELSVQESCSDNSLPGSLHKPNPNLSLLRNGRLIVLDVAL